MPSPIHQKTRPPLKRQKLDSTTAPSTSTSGTLSSLTRPISPPFFQRRAVTPAATKSSADGDESDLFAEMLFRDQQATKRNARANVPEIIDLTVDEPEQSTIKQRHNSSGSLQEAGPNSPVSAGKASTPEPTSLKRIPSPFRLTKIRDLPDSENVDAVGIKDILGNPMIKEAWVFNFLIDINWIMAQFDPDIRDIVNVRVVHGSWRRDDSNRQRMEEQIQNYPNVKLIQAYMAEAFGTHHTKMIVLFRHDDLAQVIILTANMISFDWTNMTQALWRSPLLPLLPESQPRLPSILKSPFKLEGIGETFKADLIAYLKAYSTSRTGPLVAQLLKHDFSTIRALFIASVPGRYCISESPTSAPQWGWQKLKSVLKNVPLSNDGSKGRIVAQISSIATLGQQNTWLGPILFTALSAHRGKTEATPATTTSRLLEHQGGNPTRHIVFPTVKEIRDSLNGYSSGNAVHIKIQSAAQHRQLAYLRPMLCHWGSGSTQAKDGSPKAEHQPERLAGRDSAAPHIKTYIRYADEEYSRIEWAILTSANISTQAWGSLPENLLKRLMGTGEAEFKISSWEAGVLVYPELFQEGEETVEMVPVFKKDTPELEGDGGEGKKVVGLRIPYNLPLKPYGPQEMPWSATMAYGEADWLGQTWAGE